MEFIENEKVLINTKSDRETAIEGYFCGKSKDGYTAKQFIDSIEACYFPFIWKLEYTPFKNTLESRKFLLGKKIMNKNNNSQMYIISSLDFFNENDTHWIHLANRANSYSPANLLAAFLFLDGTPIGEKNE